MSRNTALLQVASGWIIDAPDPFEVMAAKLSDGKLPIPEHQILHIDSSHKDQALADLCASLSAKDQLIVWAQFTHEIDHLNAILPDLRKSHVSRVDGSVLGAEREDSINRFKKGVTNTFLGQPGACGAGLNLQVAQHMCRYSRHHFITHHNQSMGRNRRAIRDQLYDKLVYHCLLTDQTVDFRTEMRNRGKREFSGQILLEHLSYEERNLCA